MLWKETLIALAPAAVRIEICEHLKGVAHAIGGRALALSELLDLIDLFEKRMSAYETSGDEAPLRMRHAQGDQKRAD